MEKLKKGFTLIELLVVVVIIGVLATIMVISYTGAQAKAKRAATLTAINNAVNATKVCTADGTTLAAYSKGGAVCSDTTVTDAIWPDITTNTASPKVLLNGYYYTTEPGVTVGAIIIGTNPVLSNGVTANDIKCTPTSCS